ncbi:4-hydroxyphenylpyruvate dioxygenase [Spirulina sp. CS-785/01]|uniref:4-hydroxyphenylpyruvate dioxygenase n=1 Tax=Spirulina sp. CS-785/01 TaxID=3021716 RepID=UPI00232DCBA9|nr:4-hydroxyphenylpyruvate dioxygenase [Spirulina sp. CS-785/01]MDB9315184.1 4-hydroxyphenylpyruvate dioxygenase [Spirulina sp. CS-785/01]
MKLDCIYFYLNDAQQWRDWFVTVLGFVPLGMEQTPDTVTAWVRSAEIVFALSSPLSPRSRVAQYLQEHPEGVGEVVFAVSHLDALLDRVQQLGGELLSPVWELPHQRGCQIRSITGLTHRLLEYKVRWPLVDSFPPTPFTGVDHLVLNVAAGELEETVRWYEQVFGFERQQTFAIATEESGLYSQVMVHPETGLQFPVNEPTTENSQIQEFLEVNGGAGIQHIALNTVPLISTIQGLRDRGVDFLDVPELYYQRLREDSPTLNLTDAEWEAIATQNILVDHQTDTSLLLQIFTQPIFEQPSFFFELIERRQQAEGFGEGNFRALFEAMEAQQRQRGTLVRA